MQANGENMTEIWTAAWSLGLEWSPQWRGYHGVGQYNMLNAWELDRIVEDADLRGIYINLVINNHGKFSAFSDGEWSHNPFNTALGGYLSDPEEYFTHPRALKDFRKLMRYMIARWGYSTRIFAWEFWSELNLTGSNRESGFYRRPEVVDWHRLMGRAVKEMDPNRHMVSTHYSGDYNVQNGDIVALPEMDLAPVDAYHGHSDPMAIVDLMQATADFNRSFGKPVMITEFGGSHMAQGVQHLEDTLHAALWASPCIDLGGTPMLWWWMAVEEENFYPQFAALKRFVDGEDRRDPTLQSCYAKYAVPPEATGTGGVRLRVGDGRPNNVGVWCMKNGKRALGWISRTKDYSAINPRGAPTVAELTLMLDSMEQGTRLVEFWDTAGGMPLRRVEAVVSGETLSVPVPSFARDIAFKVMADGQ
jgi:hypothetical protein